MFFRQVLNEDLGCASYLIADGGEALVVDPQWDVEPYLRLARDEGVRIAHVLETHNHADHVSGHGRLARATGAVLHAPKAADAEYDHHGLEDGDSLEVGEVRITAIATPGHRPEHLAYAVSDTSRDRAPWLVLSGDSLFVADVARPDLAVEPDEGAAQLHGSLRRLLDLADHTEVWPGHIGGSLCGGAGMSRKPGSTIGFERRFNPLLGASRDDFVRRLTAQLQPQPPSFERIVELNRGPLEDERPQLPALAPAAVDELVRGGAFVLDGRDPREFDAVHVPRSLNVAASHSGVGTRAAWVADPEAAIVIVAPAAEAFATMLEAVGFRSLRGYLDGGIATWEAAGLEAWSTPAIDVEELARQLEDDSVVLLDVRERDEWDEGHVEGSIHVPYHELRDGAPAEVPRDRVVAVACSAGNRSSLAASLLRRDGFEGVLHVADGGVEDLPKLGIELVE